MSPKTHATPRSLINTCVRVCRHSAAHYIIWVIRLIIASFNSSPETFNRSSSNSRDTVLQHLSANLTHSAGCVRTRLLEGQLSHAPVSYATRVSHRKCFIGLFLCRENNVCEKRMAMFGMTFCYLLSTLR